MGYLGGMFPDGTSGVIGTPAVAAELPLSGVALSGVLDFVTLRARTVGAAGNSIQVSLAADAFDISEVRVDETATTVEIHVLDDATTVAELAALVNTDSTLVELVGTYNPSDIVDYPDDEFAATNLTGGTESTLTPNNGFFDGHFPDDAEADDPPTVPPTTPEGAATFALRLEAGLRVTYEWETDVFKSFDGKEQRAALLDDPRESYSGSALLADPLGTRVDIAQHAANGAVFSLGLPYEETTLSDDAAGAVIPLSDATSGIDWAVVGQRVLIHRGASNDTDVAEGVIQEVAANSITIDPAPSVDAAVEGAEIMPLVPVLLEPQQGFARYRSGAERWNIDARHSQFGYPEAAVPGELDKTLASWPVTFRASTPGVSVSISLEVGGPVEIEFGITADELGNFSLTIAVPTGTTLGELNTALVGTGLLTMLGGFDVDAVLTGADEFTLTAFTGADAGGPSEMGRGATVTEIFGRAVWDRLLENAGTMTDSVHSMTEIVELGALPFAAVEATIPDWGRHIAYTSTDWQWMKKFLATVKGRAKSFYLPTFRADLESTANATATTLTISGTTGSYDLWAARGYSVIQVQQDDALYFVRVTAVAVSGSDLVLTVEGDALDAAPVSMLSWCEFVHLESDTVEVAWASPNTFSVALTARVVQQ